MCDYLGFYIYFIHPKPVRAVEGVILFYLIGIISSLSKTYRIRTNERHLFTTFLLFWPEINK